MCLSRVIVKFVLTVAAVCACCMSLRAQNSVSTLVFDSYEWDFGRLREEDGEVSHEFTFTNTGREAVMVERVVPDCGCTAADYSRVPIPPHGKGTVVVTFDPAKIAGRFSKRVAVYSGGGSNRNMITVSGYVVGRQRPIEEEYPVVVVGNLRMEALYAAFGYVENGQSKSQTIGIANGGEAPVRIAISPANALTLVKVAAPELLQPGEKALVTLSYDLTVGEPVYGLLSERLIVSADGEQADLPFTVNAIAVDDFSGMTPENAPRCEVSPVTSKFGEVEPGSELETEIEISNTGHGVLIVRSVNERGGTRCGLEAGTAIKPGQTVKVPVTFAVPERAMGSVSGGIYFVVNDPVRPFREVRMEAEAMY